MEPELLTERLTTSADARLRESTAPSDTCLRCLKRIARSGDRHGRCSCSSLSCTASALSPESASLCKSLISLREARSGLKMGLVAR
jgi:hypothetical protein